MAIALISGSPSARSLCTSLLGEIERQLDRAGINTRNVVVRDLPAQELLHARSDNEVIAAAGRLVERAWGVVIATPICKAAPAGVLKAFLDLLGSNALSGKTVLVVAVGGSSEHLLAVDYSLRPVLAALGATSVLGSVYAVEHQVVLREDGGVDLHPDLALRLHDSTQRLIHSLDAAFVEARRVAQPRRPGRSNAAAQPTIA